ncbi:hypothetical protein AGLY_011938 [Aphis glycines]|uniref:Uncharacterized protein n=1 Tax=Aphis glycines TaxID=307491 RepID=A0A6G0TAL6_APHGL|nr:hypothetical protein AGLY_011938 [Aphis glycines]
MYWLITTMKNHVTCLLYSFYGVNYFKIKIYKSLIKIIGIHCSMILLKCRGVQIINYKYKTKLFYFVVLKFSVQRALSICLYESENKTNKKKFSRIKILIQLTQLFLVVYIPNIYGKLCNSFLVRYPLTIIEYIAMTLSIFLFVFKILTIEKCTVQPIILGVLVLLKRYPTTYYGVQYSSLIYSHTHYHYHYYIKFSRVPDPPKSVVSLSFVGCIALEVKKLQNGSYYVKYYLLSLTINIYYHHDQLLVILYSIQVEI